MAFQTYLIESITAALRWLNDWPVGLKLNTPLSQFFSTSLSLVVERWSSQPAIVIGVELIVNPVRPAQSLNRILHPLLYRPSRLVQPCRVHSTPCRCQRPFQTPRFTPHHLFLHHQPHVPMAAGFLRLAVQPLPRYIVPPTSTRICSTNIVGKRWNVLRERTDTYEYDVDQLFLGTLLFTVSAFLFPTVLTYATLFTFVRSLCSQCGTNDDRIS